MVQVLTACFAQATGVCCKKDTRSIYVIYTSAGRLRLITSIQALISYLYNLWLFLSAFHLTTNERIYQEIKLRRDNCPCSALLYDFHAEASRKVQIIKGSTSQTQGPDRTLSFTTLNSIKMIHKGLIRIKTKITEINPNFMQHIDVRSLLTLLWRTFMRTNMRGGNTDTPTVLDFCMRFPKCVNELVKRVTGTSYAYFTNPVASYYLQPTLANVAITFSNLAKFPKPAAGCLSYKQVVSLPEISDTVIFTL